MLFAFRVALFRLWAKQAEGHVQLSYFGLLQKIQIASPPLALGFRTHQTSKITFFCISLGNSQSQVREFH